MGSWSIFVVVVVLVDFYFPRPWCRGASQLCTHLLRVWYFEIGFLFESERDRDGERERRKDIVLKNDGLVFTNWSWQNIWWDFNNCMHSKFKRGEFWFVSWQKLNCILISTTDQFESICWYPRRSWQLPFFFSLVVWVDFVFFYLFQFQQTWKRVELKRFRVKVTWFFERSVVRS